MVTYADLIRRAHELLPSFQEVNRLVPYEIKGILSSEILFMAACINRPVVRIFESGRARGQSTLLLSKTFPKGKIVSIEYDAHSADVLVAEQRLKEVQNVELLYGDARVILPKLIESGDIALIDGPKMFLAVRLGLKLLASKKAAQVFIHDISPNTPERRFITLFFPEALFSDKRQLAEITSAVDNNAESMIPAEKKLDGFGGEYGYGFTLVCIPFKPAKPYRLYLALSYVFDAYERLRNKFRVSK